MVCLAEGGWLCRSDPGCCGEGREPVEADPALTTHTYVYIERKRAIFVRMHARGLTLVRNEADFSFAVEQLVLGPGIGGGDPDCVLLGAGLPELGD